MDFVLFDLDGTLIDSRLDLANSINAALIEFSLEPLPNEKIYSFVGNGVRRLVEDCLKEEGRVDLFDSVMNFFFAHYYDHLLDNTILYDGVLEVLENLKRKNTDMFIITNKSFIFTKRVIEGLKINFYFKDVICGDSLPFRKPHPQPILLLKDKYNLKFDSGIMVGDSENDIEAAKSAKVSIGWAAYGFRNKDILEKYRVDFILNKPLELLSLL
ncbi:HAD family hydrolase [Hippea maritima]|uniref:phosphoglycolate phosphatase n=1 Tax=Hippea maritima (strain ATCC 700847 / DSM 10411 / MH2) TaxID=760142 RepID=F2LWY7_HIPMA|nr:HAD-IA family hydrolase [Hippea maritima]AEA34171.1 HAD-superfamily hydrolase, subfamily IA, variant 1 [Hippea maritima DSM 10411]